TLFIPGITILRALHKASCYIENMINNEQIKQVAIRIGAAANAEHVILFGSYDFAFYITGLVHLHPTSIFFGV
ncbi:MAG: hypothetical protein PHD91_08205, partial [bacterium]|nr:hypothetical protein [bacterium]